MSAALAISPLYCDSCGAEPCENPSFCATCRLTGPEPVPPPTPGMDLKSLAVRAREMADRFRNGELAKIDAVDSAYNYAVALGLAHTVGEDIVQLVLAAAFSEREGSAT